jgi:uncharacterized protein (TIGR02145 family)
MGSTFVDPGATAFDEEDGDISNSIQVSGSVDTNTHGTYVLAYNVTDSDGNNASVVVRTINVVDNPKPSHELTINASLSGDDDVPDVGDTITYEIILSNTGNTDFFEYGLYYGTYLTDFNGNSRALTTPLIFSFSTYGSGSGYSIPGEQHFYTATFEIYQQALDSGGLTLQLNAGGYHPSASYYSTAVNEFVFGTSSDEIILDGQISANNNQIKKVADPTDNLDAVNKRYVDQRTLEQTIPGQNIGDLLYWNGQSWQKLSAPQEQSTLRFCEGELTWGPCKPQINIINAEFQGNIYVWHIINSNNSNWDEIGFYLSPTNTTPDSNDLVFGESSVENSWSLDGYNYLEFSYEPNTDYYIRAYISGDFGINYSDTVVVTTPSQDQNGNYIYSKTYGDQEWSTQNANVSTYRDGTPIPEVDYNDHSTFYGATTGVYMQTNYGKFYNWYAIMGIHDDDPSTPNKHFAPEGWHVPSLAEWETLRDYLIANGYNYDGTTTGNKIAKAMASKYYWEGEYGFGSGDSSSNNSSGFNAKPYGRVSGDGVYNSFQTRADFWTATSHQTDYGYIVNLNNDTFSLNMYQIWISAIGNSVRFVKD